MNNEIKKFHENVLNLKDDNSSYAIRRNNVAGIVYRQNKDEIYTIWFHLIKPLFVGSDNPPIRSLSLSNATYEDYLEYVNWFDNPRPHYQSYSEVEGGKLL